MSIYYLFIAFPIIIIAVFTFIFQSSLAELEGEQFKMNCPLPIYDGIASNLSIDGVNLYYDISYGNGTDNSGTFFDCSESGGLLSASTIIKDYGATFFDTIPYGWLGYVGDWLNQAGFKIGAFAKVVYLLGNAPAEVTGLAWFSLLNLILLAFIGFGVIMIARGNGG